MDVATGIHYGLISLNMYLEMVRTAGTCYKIFLLSKGDYLQLSTSSLKD